MSKRTLIAALLLALVAGVSDAQCAQEVAKLLASDGEAGDRFGRATAIHGDFSAAGTDDRNGSRGAVYVYRRVNGTWAEEAILTSSDGRRNSFGSSLATDEDVIAVGAPGDNNDTGTAYVFRYNGSWVEETVPVHAHANFGDRLGWSIGVSNDVLVLGGRFSSNAYVFRFNGSVWVDEAELSALDGWEGDTFAESVAISDSGNVIVCGSMVQDEQVGAAYVFRWDGTQWIEESKLIPSDGTTGGWFGREVAISEDIIAVSAAHDSDPDNPNSGVVYVFRWDGANWQEEAKFRPADDPCGVFGESLSIEANTIVAACSRDETNGNDSGAVYIYDWDGSAWSESEKVTPTDGSTGDRFGISVDMHTDGLIVGAYFDNDNGKNAGSAYMFTYGADCPAALTGFTIDTGTLLGGALGDLLDSDDLYVHARSGFGSTLIDLHNTEMIVDAVTNVDAPIALDLTIESRIDEPVGTEQVRLKNWGTGTFIVVGQHSIGTSDASVAIENIDPTNFVSVNGDIQLSIKHIVFVPFLAFQFESWFDFVEIVVR